MNKTNKKVTSPKSEKMVRKRKISEDDDDLTQQDIADLLGIVTTPKDKKAKIMASNTDPVKKKIKTEKENKSPVKEIKSPVVVKTETKQVTQSPAGKKKRKAGADDGGADDDDGGADDEATSSNHQGKMSSPKLKKRRRRKRGNKDKLKDGVVDELKNGGEMDGLKDLQAEQERKKEEDNKRHLYVSDLGVKVVEADLKKLSADILEATIKRTFLNKSKGGDRCFAYLRFENEQIADRNLEKLKEKMLKGKLLDVDYVGLKSWKFTALKETETKKKPNSHLDAKRLYITGFDKSSTTEDALKRVFVGASEVALPVRRHDNKFIGYAFVNFEDEEVCRGYFEREGGVEIEGRKLTVCFANKKK